MNKQKKVVKKQCKMIAQNWILEKRDSLKLPKKLKLSNVKFRANEKEMNVLDRYNKWREIDSLLCIKKDPEYIAKAKKRLLELKLVVFDIGTEFNFIPTANQKISSTLNFEFDFEGNFIRAIIRKKEMSPYSEIPYK